MHLVVMLTAYLSAIIISDVLPTILHGVIALRHGGVGRHSSCTRSSSQLHQLSSVDPLTGALNRRGLEQQAPGVRSMSSRAARRRASRSSTWTSSRSSTTRTGTWRATPCSRASWPGCTTTCARTTSWRAYGGDEFVVAAARQHRAGGRRGDRPRAPMRARHPWTWGIARWVDGETLWEVIDRADRALYEAKRARRAPFDERPVDHGSEAARARAARRRARGHGPARPLAARSAATAPRRPARRSPLTTRATPPTMMAPPISTPLVRLSPSTSVPSATATTGLT